ncbi:MAG: TonB-dependent receptor [Spongiibacteraceae bacterium]|nr:TonB-dependent receptor [Spongiibacteraceae bacterium]
MKKRKGIFRVVLLVSSISLLPGWLNAQEDESIEEVIITGSRIVRSGTDTPTPVSILDSESLKISANTTVADTLFQLPQTGIPGASQTNSNFTVFASGLSTVDLRNLDEKRTLVLVNGRRHVGGDSENPSAVDLNAIPSSFIDRIEVMTGGASAVYGSEAMAGVINIIMKENFEGVELSVQSGSSDNGDGENDTFSLTAGSSFSNDRGNVMIHMGYNSLKDIESKDRTLSKTDNRLGDFAAFSTFSPKGSVLIDGDQFTQYTDGTWGKPFVRSEDGFNRAAFRKIQLPLEQKSVATVFNYKLSESIGLFAEASYNGTKSFRNLEPTITGLNISVGDVPLVLPGDNPFIPQGIVDLYAGQGITLPNADESIIFLKRFLELGPRTGEPERDSTRVLLGFDGTFAKSWSWETYYQWGRSKSTHIGSGDFNTFFFQQGLDVEVDPANVGAYRCKNSLARSLGCVPIDIFGEGSISQAAVDYVAVPRISESEIQQQVASFVVSGNLMDLPAGALGVAGGIEWRKEQLDVRIDALASAGLSSSNASAPVSGSFDVMETFMELSIPLLSNAPLVEYLGVDAAYRFSDYSTVGNVETWKLGSQWSPNKELTIRATTSEATRAPNVAELFDPGSETFERFIDPCTNGGVGGKGNTQANCASEGVNPGFDPGINGGSAGGLQSGNPLLQEETAKSWTLGFVYTPDWLENASLTVDYYDINIEDAIELIEPQIKLNECYASASFPNDPLCNGIERLVTIGNIINRLDFGTENIGELRTAGVDTEFNYRWDLANIGQLHLIWWPRTPRSGKRS